MGAARHLFSAALLLALAACTSAPGVQDATEPAPTAPSTASTPSSTLIALGDSFTAGPGIGEVQDGSGYCQRSAENWPSLFATATGLDLRDVSCVGATTADLASTVSSGVLDRGARIVTIGTGGNDSGLFSSLITSCASGGATCASFVEKDLPGILGRTTSDVAALLKTVRDAVPQASVVLIGYPRIVPDAGTCEALGVPESDLELLEAAESALDRSLSDAAERAGEQYVSLRAAARGHDACAGTQAWTNGRTAAPGDGISFHPTARGMEAVAQLVARSARTPAAG